MALIGIIMPCFYEDKIVRQALHMLNQQTRKDEIEVIMINDCSPNTDCEYQNLIQEFPEFNIRYLKTEFNSGPGVARQLGIDNCDCPWVLFHDDDDTLNNPYVIERYLEVIKQSENTKGILNAIYGLHQREHDISGGFTGNVYNLNLIKLFNITFDPVLSFFEEDSHFLIRYQYYVYRLSEFYPCYLVDLETISDDISITYTKKFNEYSICGILDNDSRVLKSLRYINQVFKFYLEVPQDRILDNIFKKDLESIFDYFYNLLKDCKQSSKLSSEQKLLIEESCMRFGKIINDYPYVSTNKLQQYFDLIKSF